MLHTIQFILEGVLTATLGIFGIFGNIVSIKVLSSRDLDMLPTFRHLLKMLAVFDATFLIFTVTLFCISSWSSTYNEFVRPWLTPYWLPVIQISLTGSVWTTMAVSIERFLTVCLSYRSNTVQHLFYTLPIVLFSLVFNIPRFFELTTVEVPGYTMMYNETLGANVNTSIDIPKLEATTLRTNPRYSRDYVLIANSFALGFIPMIVLIILNSLIFRWVEVVLMFDALRVYLLFVSRTISKATKLHNAISSTKRRDHSVAMMLIAIVVVFIICHSLRFATLKQPKYTCRYTYLSVRSVINTYECYQMVRYGELKYWPDWIQYLVHFNHFGLVVNSSINILIYSCKDEKFLNVLLITIGMKPPRGPTSR